MPEGFEWLIGDDATNSVYAWLRWSRAGKPLLVVVNFTPVPREAYRIGVPVAGHWQVLINSDSQVYAGSGSGNTGAVSTDEQQSHGHGLSLCLNLPPLAVLILQPPD